MLGAHSTSKKGRADMIVGHSTMYPQMQVGQSNMWSSFVVFWSLAYVFLDVLNKQDACLSHTVGHSLCRRLGHVCCTSAQLRSLLVVGILSLAQPGMALPLSDVASSAPDKLLHTILFEIVVLVIAIACVLVPMMVLYIQMLPRAYTKVTFWTRFGGFHANSDNADESKQPLVVDQC